MALGPNQLWQLTGIFCEDDVGGCPISSDVLLNNAARCLNYMSQNTDVYWHDQRTILFALTEERFAISEAHAGHTGSSPGSAGSAGSAGAYPTTVAALARLLDTFLDTMHQAHHGSLSVGHGYHSHLRQLARECGGDSDGGDDDERRSVFDSCAQSCIPCLQSVGSRIRECAQSVAQYARKYARKCSRQCARLMVASRDRERVRERERERVRAERMRERDKRLDSYA